MGSTDLPARHSAVLMAMLCQPRSARAECLISRAQEPPIFLPSTSLALSDIKKCSVVWEAGKWSHYVLPNLTVLTLQICWCSSKPQSISLCPNQREDSWLEEGHRDTVSKSKGTQCLHQNWTKHAWESRSRSTQNERARGCRRQTYRTTSHWTGESRRIFSQIWKGKGAHSSLSFNSLLEFLARAIKQEKEVTEISGTNLINFSSTLETTETLSETWRPNKHSQQSSKM